jgi:SpoVK/Ycf46/Vps4 family AAA+-type ATPase
MFIGTTNRHDLLDIATNSRLFKIGVDLPSKEEVYEVANRYTKTLGFNDSQKKVLYDTINSIDDVSYRDVENALMKAIVSEIIESPKLEVKGLSFINPDPAPKQHRKGNYVPIGSIIQFNNHYSRKNETYVVIGRSDEDIYKLRKAYYGERYGVAFTSKGTCHEDGYTILDALIKKDAKYLMRINCRTEKVKKGLRTIVEMDEKTLSKIPYQ